MQDPLRGGERRDPGDLHPPPAPDGGLFPRQAAGPLRVPGQRGAGAPHALVRPGRQPGPVYLHPGYRRLPGPGVVLLPAGGPGGPEPGAGGIPAHRLRRHPGRPPLVRGGGHLSDLPRPLPPHRRTGPSRHGGGALGPCRLGRGAGVAARRPGGDPQPGLFRRVPGGGAGKAGLPEGAGGGHPLLLSRLRGGGEPPLRHRGLRENRPHAGHGGVLSRLVRRRPRPGHEGAAGRSLQPPGLCEQIL